jgi:hypothetical protein
MFSMYIDHEMQIARAVNLQVTDDDGNAVWAM